jgi:signal transduction histidine kinase
MASAGGVGGRIPVRRHLAVLVAANLFVLLVLGVAGIAAAIRAHDSVHYLTERVEPAVTANSAALQHLTDAETYLWGWAISGDAQLLTSFRTAVDAYQADRGYLVEALDSLDGQAALLVDDFNLATDDWFTVYVYPRLALPTGTDNIGLDRFARGQRLFDEVRAANAAVSDRLDELTEDADRSSRNLMEDIVVVLAAMLLAGSLLSTWVGSLVGRRVTRPLRALEDTAHRLAVGEHDARAPVSGPREVVQVATAINRMADENDRARAVEARVVEQLRALDGVKSDFVSNVSHELRTPLTSILG